MQLSTAEKRIYKYLISNDITNKSADSIAESLFVSRTSIYRVCKKLGYSSFSHFKFAQNNDAKKNVMKNVNSLDVFNHVNDQHMEQIIEQIIASEIIYVFGTHATSLAANYLVRQLVNLGYLALQVVDEFELDSRKHNINNADCLICLSNSGSYHTQTFALLDRIECPIIAITKEDSMLANEADFSIVFDFPFGKDNKSFEREHIFNLIVVAEKLLVNLNELQP